MSTQKDTQSKSFVNDLSRRLDELGIPQHGRNVALAKASGYSASLVSEVMNEKKTCTPRFYKLACEGLALKFVQSLTIAEQVGPGYGPEVKLMADYLEVKIKGKTAEERLKIVEGIMADIRSKYR